MRVLYISPLDDGANASLDAMCQSLASTLRHADIELWVALADFRQDGWRRTTERLINEGVQSGFRAFVLYVIDDNFPKDAVLSARRSGCAVVTFERPCYEVDGCVVYPNFNQGAYLAQHLGRLLPPGARVGVVGGPGTADDEELVLGILRGIDRAGLIRVNDPFNPRYRNTEDVRDFGRHRVENLLDDHPRVAGLVPYNDETAIGACEALRSRGLAGRVKVVSRNGTPDAVALVKEGVHHGTWDIETMTIGRQAAELVIRAVAAENTGSCCVISPIGHLIGRHNVDSWRPWEKRIAFRPLTKWPSASAPA